MRSPLLLCVVALLAVVSNAGLSWQHLAATEPLRFERDVRPILSDKCFHCHGPDEGDREADLRLDLEESARPVLQGDLNSLLIERVLTSDEDLLMPPPHAKKPLSEEEKSILKQWVLQGAEWTQHWAFLPPEPKPVDVTNDSPWVRNPIDGFVLQQLKSQGLEPNPEASKTTLIRRLTLDLTGLPPTLDEIDGFLADDSPAAYEKLVDRLLASEHFGERMAVMWLDAARYGDTSVYHADGPRDMWAWRDAVVQAYNENMPFDQFSIAQLAADHLPQATLHEQILGGFNRNNGTTDEGGAFAEEYRVEYCVDRVKTTSSIWLGLSLECAQCHDHKYDPISQKEYYQFYAFFNVSADAGMQTRNGNAAPTLPIPDPEKQAQIPAASQELVSVKQEIAAFRQDQESAFLTWLDEQTSASSPRESPTGLLVDLPLNEGEGSQVAYQQQGNWHQAPITGNPEWTPSPLDQALRFSGQHFIDLGNVGDFEKDQAFSYGGWINANQNFGAVLARMDDANDYRGYDLFAGTGGVAMHIIHRWPEDAIKVVTQKKLEAGKWYHIFATYSGNGQASGIKIFVDGEEWKWNIEQDGLKGSIRTEKSLLIGSRHPGSRFQGEIDQIQIFDRALTAREVKSLADQSKTDEILAIAPSTRTEEQRKTLFEHFLTSEKPEYHEMLRQRAELETRLAELQKPLTTVMVMRDMEKPRDTFVLNRGSYDSPTEQKVEAATLSVLPPMQAELPRNRLGLARWLFSDDQPLTARVTVNRYWMLLFGQGLVATPQDFGSQGAYPSHPELLDWLAWDFRTYGWNIKRTLKQMLMSSTYRQASAASAEKYRRDPTNRWLARGPRFRLQAEFVRDSALAISGLLNPRLGGPGVKPYQPAGLWVEVGLSGKPAFQQDHGDKLYRRSLYTYWKRSAPPPSMQLFDAPTREKCTIQRPRTNTPLQALVVLNDPQFVEASRKFAENLIQASTLDSERIQLGFRRATARPPSPSETTILLDILAEARQEYADNRQGADDLLKVGESQRTHELQAEEAAAWTVVASTLLNLDETLTRE